MLNFLCEDRSHSKSWVVHFLVVPPLIAQCVLFLSNGIAIQKRPGGAIDGSSGTAAVGGRPGSVKVLFLVELLVSMPPSGLEECGGADGILPTASV